MFAGLFLWITLPSPSSRGEWLTQNEVMQIECWNNQIASEKSGNDEFKDLDRPMIWKSLTSPVSWSFAILYLFSLTTIYGVAYFLPAIFGEMGFDDLMRNLMTVPVYLLTFFALGIVSYIADSFIPYIPLIVILACLCTTIGYSQILVSSKYQITWLGILGANLANIGSYSTLPVVLSWLSASIRREFSNSSTANGVAIGLVISFGSFGGVIGPQLYSIVTQRGDGSIDYFYGHLSMTICGVISVLVASIIGLVQYYQSKTNYQVISSLEQDPLLANKK